MALAQTPESTISVGLNVLGALAWLTVALPPSRPSAVTDAGLEFPTIDTFPIEEITLVAFERLSTWETFPFALIDT